ncbi:MAG: tRNA pseudouridine(38-40) synthase TruA [Deltaproteobacteria bacterium]|jgi:tRNA pseudouridine38-40 synthase|nr:tRNA pseudouridine(38-40) synthase TruA [Deltaproteobacteria bacterium]MBW2478225.1 tRNA pseudouridine(38-40) synthase TruA [Deltaproteobacteria bacterium]MBW2504235.1 tRNA pseudouridine(38-40) synthase TruA [Deltaproteobacteria bacterium]
MRKILLIVEFLGTHYSGWQLQPNAPSVQGVVEDALAKVLGQAVRLHSAGRTDAGVHARRMPAHFQTEVNLPTVAFRDGVNRFLPADIAVQEAREVPDGFHARFSACRKWYRYTLFLNQVRSPLSAQTSWHLKRSLDLQAMKAGAFNLVGHHDFSAFRSSTCAAKTTAREIFDIQFSQDGPFLFLDFHGSGFLKNMVRMMVGTLIEIGLGKRPADDIARLLNRERGLRSGPTAPPQGLCLMDVYYNRLIDGTCQH